MSEQILIFFQIVFIDLVLAGDNAIIIGMVASQFPTEQRKKIIFWGIGAAVVLRIIFTLIAAYLLQINGLRLIGGLLLLYICYKLYQDVIRNKAGNENTIKIDNSSFVKAITTVILGHSTFVILIGVHLMNGQAEGPTPVINIILNLVFITLYVISRKKA